MQQGWERAGHREQPDFVAIYGVGDWILVLYYDYCEDFYTRERATNEWITEPVFDGSFMVRTHVLQQARVGHLPPPLQPSQRQQLARVMFRDNRQSKYVKSVYLYSKRCLDSDARREM